VSASRFFRRLAVAGSVEEALDGAAGAPAVLHTHPGGEIVGLVEVRPFTLGELYSDGELLECEGVGS
jgi:hypothetical protein